MSQRHLSRLSFDVMNTSVFSVVLCNNCTMKQNRILQELVMDKESDKIRNEIFGATMPESGIKKGLSFKEIAREMKKASKEKLFQSPLHGTAC